MAPKPGQHNCVDQSAFRDDRERDRSALIYRLDKAGRADAAALARALESCGAAECGSPVCPVCGSIHQAAAPSRIDIFIRGPPTFQIPSKP